MDYKVIASQEELDKVAALPDELFKKIPDDEKNSEFIATETTTYMKDVWRRLNSNKVTTVALIVIALVILMAILGPILSGYTYDGQDLTMRNAMPCKEHLFGTDKFGRDIFTRVAYGARISLTIGFSAAIINLVIGIIYGGIAGYAGGRVDMIMMRIVDILYCIPSSMYVILIMVVLGANMYSVLVGICISSWVGMARMVRSQVLSLKQQEFAMAATVLGASRKRILFKHLIINAMGPIMVSLTMQIPSAMFTEAFLSFIGLGVSKPMASWGSLANAALPALYTNPYQLFYPALVMSITILALNLFSDGLRDSLDPRLRK